MRTMYALMVMSRLCKPRKRPVFPKVNTRHNKGRHRYKYRRPYTPISNASIVSRPRRDKAFLSKRLWEDIYKWDGARLCACHECLYAKGYNGWVTNYLYKDPYES